MKHRLRSMTLTTSSEGVSRTSTYSGKLNKKSECRVVISQSLASPLSGPTHCNHITRQNKRHFLADFLSSNIRECANAPLLNIPHLI